MGYAPEDDHAGVRLPNTLKDWAISVALFAVGYAMLYAWMSIPQ